MKVPDFHRERFETGDWTDDTDQMILIMQSIVEQKGEVSERALYSFQLKMTKQTRSMFMKPKLLTVSICG